MKYKVDLEKIRQKADELKAEGIEIDRDVAIQAGKNALKAVEKMMIARKRGRPKMPVTRDRYISFRVNETELGYIFRVFGDKDKLRNFLIQYSREKAPDNAKVS